jgi:hypothetical protein
MRIPKRRKGLTVTGVRNHVGLLFVLAAYLAVTLTFGLLYPLGEPPDERAHVDAIRFIGEEGHLPRNLAEREAAGYKSDWPLLYHALTAAATGWIDYDILPRLKKNEASPRRLLIEDGLLPFTFFHTNDEEFPYYGLVLGWHLSRLVSTLLSVGTLIVTYIAVLRIWPDDRWLALGVTAVLATMPMFQFMASVASDENLVGLLSALFILTLLKIWQRPEPRWTYVLLGVYMGLAMTTKYTVVLLPLLVVVALIFLIRRGVLGWQAAVTRLLIFGAVTAIVAAWWFVYVEWYFNEVRDLGLIAGLVKPLLVADRSEASGQMIAFWLTGGKLAAPNDYIAKATIWDWATHLFRSFWFMKTKVETGIEKALTPIFLGLCGLAAAGLWRAWRRHHDLPWSTLGLLAFQIVLLVAISLMRFLLILSPTETGQGRHILIPAAITASLLFTLGVSAWFPPAYRRFVGLGLAGVLLSISLVNFFGYLLPTFPPRLPVRTSTKAIQEVPNRINVSFGNAIELVGYETGEVNQYSALPVTLFWHSLAYVDQDYLIELSLLDEEDVVRSLWLGHPAGDRYPTRAWDPGDVAHGTAWLPVTSLEAGDYKLRLRLRSSLNYTSEQPGGTHPSSMAKTDLLLTDLRLPPQPATARTTPYPALPAAPAAEAMGYSLIVWQAGKPVTGEMPEYRYRDTIPISLQSEISNPISLVGPNGVEHAAQAQAGNVYIFLVDAYWPSGEYALQVQGASQTITSDPILRVKVRPRNFDVPPMSTEVRANFGDEMVLLGYDFPERRAQPGGALPITVYWQALRPMDRSYIVSNHLLYSSDLRQWGGRDRVPKAQYSTTIWVPGEVVRDDYLVPVDPSAPPGVYRLDIGLYVELVGQRWHLPLVQDGTALDTNSVTIVPIKVGGPPPGVTVQSPSPQHLRADNLEGLVTLLGYDWSLEPEALDLTLYWRCDAPLPTDYTTFVHVRDATGQVSGQSGSIVAQMDRPTGSGAYPTSLWDPGEIIRDSIQVPVPPQVPTGEYEIVVGLYDFATGRRLFVLNQNGESIGDHIRLDEEISVR